MENPLDPNPRFPLTPASFRNQGRTVNVDPTINIDRASAVTICDAQLNQDAGSTLMTVGLVSGGPDNDLNWNPVCYLQIGNGGVTAELEIDYNSGTVFSVGGSSIRVSAFLDPRVNFPAFGYSTGKLGAFVSLGGFSRNEQLKRTVSVIGVNPLPVIVPIPTFSSSVQVLRFPIGSGFLVTVLDNALNPSYQTLVNADENMDPLLLANDAFYISLDLNGAQPQPTVLRLVFGINL